MSPSHRSIAAYAFVGECACVRNSVTTGEPRTQLLIFVRTYTDSRLRQTPRCTSEPKNLGVPRRRNINCRDNSPDGLAARPLADTTDRLRAASLSAGYASFVERGKTKKKKNNETRPPRRTIHYYYYERRRHCAGVRLINRPERVIDTYLGSTVGGTLFLRHFFRPPPHPDTPKASAQLLQDPAYHHYIRPLTVFRGGDYF